MKTALVSGVVFLLPKAGGNGIICYMRVLFFNYEYPPLGGGAANATFCILREFSKVPGLEVDLVTSSIDDKVHVENISQNVRIHRLPIGKNAANLHFQSQKDLLTYSWKAYFYARKLIKKEKYDLTHSFFTVPCGFLSLVFKYQFNLSYIISLRGSDVPGYSDRFSFIYNFLRPLIVFIWKRGAAVISNSEGLRDLARKSNAHQEIGVIYNGVDIDHFKPYESIRRKDKFIITPGASRITARKGLKYLVEAVHKLLPKYPNLFLKIMGEGNEEENLKKLVKDLRLEKQVEFLGRIPRENTVGYYQEASLFVMPSLNEGMSNAMLEALSCGLPLIATDTGGSTELIEEGKNGFIVQMENSQSVAEKIELFLKDENLRTDMSAASRKRAEELSWENVAKQYAELYRGIIRNL